MLGGYLFLDGSGYLVLYPTYCYDVGQLDEDCHDFVAHLLLSIINVRIIQIQPSENSGLLFFLHVVLL